MKIFKHNINQIGETSLMQTIMVAALIIAAFFIGMLWTKVQTYEKNGVAAKPSSGTVTDTVGTDTTGTGTDTTGQPPAKILVDPITAKDHVRGNRNARVALVEYSDLECPFCKEFHPTAKQMLSAYGDKIMWVFRHFPLSELHSKAPAEAAAAECATKLGGEDKFWAFIDKVYEVTPGNNGLDPSQLPIIAGQVGLNVNQFIACQTSGGTSSVVTADYNSGLKAGINGTPGNILLDTKTGATYEIPGAVPYDQLKQMIDSFMATLN